MIVISKPYLFLIQIVMRLRSLDFSLLFDRYIVANCLNKTSILHFLILWPVNPSQNKYIFWTHAGKNLIALCSRHKYDKYVILKSLHLRQWDFRLLQQLDVVLQFTYGQLWGLHVALHLLQLLLLLSPQLLQKAGLLILQDLMQRSEFTFDTSLQVCSQSLTGRRDWGYVKKWVQWYNYFNNWLSQPQNVDKWFTSINMRDMWHATCLCPPVYGRH